MSKARSVSLALVPWALTLCGTPLPPEASGGASTINAILNALPKKSKQLDEFVTKAARNLDETAIGLSRDLSEAQQQNVEAQLMALLVEGNREALLGAALFGHDKFHAAVVADGLQAELPDKEWMYLTGLVRRTHELIFTFARSPEVFPSAGTNALLTIQKLLNEQADQARIDADTRAQTEADFDTRLTRVEENQTILHAITAELQARNVREVPNPLIRGARPVLAQGFVTRDEFQLVSDALATGGLASVSALQGMRGAGKTQLAAAFARRCHHDGWRTVIWINAATREMAAEELRQIGISTGLTTQDDPELAARDVVAWVNSAGPEDQLVVFDNVTNASHVKDLTPDGPGVRVLLTMTGHPGNLGTPIVVGVYTENQAINYLESVTGLNDPEGASLVAHDLGNLPLALTQAANVIRFSTRKGYAGYRKRLETRLLDQSVKVLDGDPYDDKVGAALRMAYADFLERLEKEETEQCRAATDVLYALSLLAETGVPAAWLEVLHEDSVIIEDAIDALIRHSLLTESVDAQGQEIFALHRLQAQVIREDLIHTGRIGEAREAAITVLDGVALDSSDDYWEQRKICSTLSAQLAALREQKHSAAIVADPQVFEAAGRTIWHSNELQNPYPALALAGYVTDRERVLGPDHPDTLGSRNNLAGAYQAAGNLAEAIPLYQQTLTDSERVLGPDHPDTLTSRNNLAYAYRSAGNLAEAIPLYQQTLTDRERVLGPDHPDTLGSRNNLAYAYQAAGNLAEAIPLYQQTLTDSERVLGPDHPDILTSRNNLAGAYQAAGNLAEAIPLYQQTLTDRERILGPDHPDTLGSRNNLAYAYQAAGNLAEAIPLYQQTLTDRERILGPDHPQTLGSRNNLAYAYQAAGNLAEAIPLYQQTLTDSERILGPDHPQTLGSRNNLAYAYRSAGNLAEAIPLYQQTLTDRERILGPDHPDTLGSRNNLAYAYRSAGNLAEAIPLYQQTLTDRERVLGPDHPQTLTSRNNLAGAYQAAGNLAEAIPLYQQTLTDSERILGPDHPDTLGSRNNLAYAYLAIYKFRDAIVLFRRALADCERILGADHPTSRTVRGNLADARRRALWS